MTRRPGTPLNGLLNAALLASIVTVLSPMGGTPGFAADIGILEQTGNAFASVSEQATPAVVFIHAEKTVTVHGQGQPFSYNDPFGFFGLTPRGQAQPRRFKQQGQGSGFIISKDGYILTNHHVVGDADKIMVKLQDGREFEAERVGTDEKSEVAVIKIDGDDLPTLAMGDSSAMRVGEWVIAIGNPFGLDATVTVGIVSAKGRSHVGIADYENFIQTDAAINPGNSGGPLLNIRGEVIGINTAIYSKSGGDMGIGFAIPANMAAAIKDQLITSGKVTRGYLGVVIQDVTPDLAESFGLEKREGILISDVSEDSPAEKAKLMEGDIILKLDGKDVGDVGEFRNRVAAQGPGTAITLTVFRDGKEKKIKAETGSLPGESLAAADMTELMENLGLNVQDLTEEIAGQLRLEPDAGVLVAEVEEGSPAWESGIKPGNLITGINRVEVSNVEELQAAIESIGLTDTILLRIRDRQYSRYVVLRLE